MLTSLAVKKKKLHFLFTPIPNLGIVLLGHAIKHGPSAKEGFTILDLQKLGEFIKRRLLNHVDLLNLAKRVSVSEAC